MDRERFACRRAAVIAGKLRIPQAETLPQVRSIHAGFFENRLGDERILGSSAFVESVRQTLQADEAASPRQHSVTSLITAVCATTGGHPPALREGSRRPPAARARERVAYLALEVCGDPALAIADLGVRPSAVYRAAQRGKATSARWDRLLAGIRS